MASQYSNPSQVSMKSQMVLEEVSRKSSTKLGRLTGIFDDEDIRASWNAFGLYVSRQLRMGRAVTIPLFGLFTFTAPDVTLDGVSNPWERDKQFRNPVFIIGKDFANGFPIKSGIAQSGSIRPYKVHGINGKIAQTKVNFTEVGIYCNKTRDQAQQAVMRVIRQVSDDTKSKGIVDMEIPNVGIFRVRNMVAAVSFNTFLTRDAKVNTHNFKTVQQKKTQVNSNLTKETINRFESFKNMSDNMRGFNDEHLEIDDRARTFLRNSLAIDVNSMMQNSQNRMIRPKSSQNRHSWVNGGGSQSQNQWDMENSIKNRYRRPQTSTNKQQLGLGGSLYGFSRNKRIESDVAFRQLKYWIRQKCLNAEDAFTEFCKSALGQVLNVSSRTKVKLTTENLYNGLKMLEIEMNPVSVQELHRILDHNKDGFIDLSDWVAVISEQNNAYLQRIKDIIMKFNINTDDLLLTMGLKRGEKSINLVKLKDALRKLDQTLDDLKAISAAKALLNNTECIDVEDIIAELGCDQESLQEQANNVSPDLYQNTLVRIRQKLAEHQNPNILKDQFEKQDLQNIGRIDFVKFKTCLLNCNLGFTVNEVNRLLRFMQLDEDQMIDYMEFLREVMRSNRISSPLRQTNKGNGLDQQQEQGAEEEEEENQEVKNYFENFQDFTAKLKIFIKKNTVQNAADFHEKVLKSLNVQELNLNSFVTFLYKKGFPQSTEEEIYPFARRMDIDSDGVISQEDLSIFFSRLEYLENDDTQSTFSASGTQSAFNKSRITPENPKQTPVLYPTSQLEPAKISVLIRELKQKLYLKKLSFFDFFKRLDENQDGFITIEEWSKNIDGINKYSKKIKDGLFAFIDKKQIGMIDYQTFLAQFEADGGQLLYNNDSLNKNQGDEWEWTQHILTLIREWFSLEALTVEDAFRVMDKDFDGFIGKNDIEQFLQEVLHISPKEITQDKVNRIFKLLDEFKRGQIELTDLKRLLVEKKEQNANFAVTGGKFTQGRSSFEWRTNAKQQLGIVLSRKFNSLHQSFEEIANFKDKIVYKNFENWVKNSRALIGFDLSDYQIQMVFSDIDPHKKGYLTERDWVLAFSGFNWRNQMILEIQETTMTHFNNFEQAFLFYSQGDSQNISEGPFKQAIRALFQQRFSSHDIDTVWKQLVGTGNGIDRVNFVSIFDDQKGHKKLNHADAMRSSRIKNPFGDKTEKSNFMDAIHKTPAEEFMDAECEKIVRKVKSILRASNKSMKQIFEEFDKDGSGNLSNLEFKNAFRNIGIGLTSREIDYLLNYCDESGDGFINWQEFMAKFKLGEAQNRIIDRSRQRLQHINDNIHYYMLSPKDAFRLFNEDRTGNMNYNDFTNFMQKLCLMANEELPSFAILKDIYQTIDIRKDGHIDMAEWIQTFKQFQPPNASMQGRPMMHQQENNRAQTAQVGQSRAKKSQGKTQSSHNPLAYHIEASQEYDKIMQVIGRNRKFLLQTFNDINKFKAVTFNVAKDIIVKLLMSVGIVLEEDHYPLLIKFAERDGIVDYRFMLEVYKERIHRISQQPDPNLM